jgi:hypothetical protein
MPAREEFFHCNRAAMPYKSQPFSAMSFET